MKIRTNLKRNFVGVLGSRRVFLLGLIFLIIFWLTFSHIFCQSLKTEPQEKDIRWYSIYLGGQKIGFVKETGEKIQEKNLWYFKTITESKIVLNRLGKKIELIFNSVSLEDENGHLKKMLSDQILSSQPIRIEAEVKEAKISLKTTSGGKTFSRDLPYTGTLLGPVGIGRLSSENLKKPGDKVEYRTLLAELSQVASGERVLASEEELEYRGEKIKTRKIEEKLSGLAYLRQVWMDDQGNEIKAVEPSPFGEMITLISSEKEALSGLEASSPRQDQYQATLIKSNVRLPQARGLERVVIKLKHQKPELGWPEIQNEYQRVREKTQDTMILELKRVEAKLGPKRELSVEEKTQYLRPNPYLDAADPEIKKVAKIVVGSEKDSFKKALKLRNWVSENMSFDLGFVFAPASEVIRSKRATCAGYAALLASLLRAAEIPSRYVVGLAYINGVWGGHAWVEAWVEGKWVPLDAAIPSPGVADPARLAIAWSSLDEGLGDTLTAAQRVFGYLDIEILEFSLNGQRIKIAEGQPLYQVKKGIYWNSGLQISFEAPSGFDFSDLDKVWPDKTLLKLKSSGDQVLELKQESWFPADNLEKYLVNLLKKEVKDGKLAYVKVWGKKRPMLVSDEKSAVAIMNGLDLFILIAQGRDSEMLLKRGLSTFQNRLLVD
ncbi:MAG: transglutaminase-like domain-containing protein [Candidatus Saccharicenans sp.]